MNIVSAKEMAQLEAKAYQEGFKESDFMEKAGEGIAKVAMEMIDHYCLKRKIIILCGKGNNGGDALVAGRYLIQNDFEVLAVRSDPFEKISTLNQLNSRRFLDAEGKIIASFNGDWKQFGLIIDGLFGTGFKGKVGEPYAILIREANKSGVPILSVDIPSGVDGNTGQVEGDVIEATQTAFLGLPKWGLFLQDGWNVAGHLRFVDFGCPRTILDQAKNHARLLTDELVRPLLPPIVRNRHKYQVGLVMGLAGSPGMPGAAMLSSLAALRGGCGIVKLLHPQGMEAELSSSPYELIRIPYLYEDSKEILAQLKKGKAIFVGPGLGKSEQVKTLLKKIFPHLDAPCVIDADALALLAEGEMHFPKQAILTPHTGEMQRLLGRDENLKITEETLKICQDYADSKKITLVLKGAPTFIFHPGKPIYVSPTGNPGMATAGSGDVLTGLIASLAAQGMDPHSAALLGVYLHGLSGEFAATMVGSRSLIASDLISHFSDGFHYLMNDTFCYDIPN